MWGNPWDEGGGQASRRGRATDPLEGWRLFDVTQEMDAFRFPGNPGLEVRGPFSRVEGKTREYVYDLSFCSQTGTHVQGGHYFLEEGSRIEAYPLESFAGPCAVVDLTRRGEDTEAEELESLLREEDFSCPALVFRTGHMEEVLASGRLDPERRPGLSLRAARYLTERGTRLVGIDSVGLESRRSRSFEVCRHFGREGVLLLEGLVGLEALKGRYGFLQAFPLKISGVEGTPCRAVVWQREEPLGAGEGNASRPGAGGEGMGT